MTSTNRTDGDVQNAVLQELQGVSDVDDAGIGVAVEDGTVALSGEVDSFFERLAAERAALRVRGVTAVIDNLTVHSKYSGQLTETDIAKEAERALRATSGVPSRVKAVIDGHDVALLGEVEWDYQRRTAQRAVEHLTGVQTVKNLITLSSPPASETTVRRIRSALDRNAQLDASTISISVDGTAVTLAGTVGSWHERSQIANTAWASPHVTAVDNHIVVRAQADA